MTPGASKKQATNKKQQKLSNPAKEKAQFIH
jgi:hypothetical protein